jgi:two-component system phosphate regulon sensor histidine kinase PhoR
MKDPLKRITIVFAIVALLPVALIVYQLRLINTDEQIVREAYQNQLDAILYSVNQYSDDVMASWANSIRQVSREHAIDSAFVRNLSPVLAQHDVVRYVYLTDTLGRSILLDLADTTIGPSGLHTSLDNLLPLQKEKLHKLVEYERAGFRKMQAINTEVLSDQIPIFFAFDNSSRYQLGALIVNLPAFIQGSLAPKMQAISRDKFIISAMSVANDSLIYSTEPGIQAGSTQAAQEFKEQVLQTEFWILPGYFLGISLKGATIDDLVATRTSTTQIFLGFLGVLLTGGIFFLYSNIRKEIQLSQAKSEFVSNVSHEIRTPLSLIGMFAETLETGRVTTEEKKQEYYGIISKETTRLTKIVNRILNFSQLEANRKQFRFVSLDLNAVCADILKSYFHHLEDKGFEVDFLPRPDIWHVQADKEATTEVIVNLLDNAVKYSREHITLRTGMNKTHCYVEVEDEGIGIERSHQREVFEQFFRVPTGDVHTTKGTGLGLTLVKRIMDAHSGTVDLSSMIGRGSIFRVSFPLKTETKQ